MAINKTINKPAKTHGALRNCIEYVLREHKTEEALVYMTGPAPEILDYNSVYQSFLSEKRLWNKDKGRMCAHNVISFHKDEKITLQEALEFGKEFVSNRRLSQVISADYLRRKYLPHSAVNDADAHYIGWHRRLSRAYFSSAMTGLK